MSTPVPVAQTLVRSLAFLASGNALQAISRLAVFLIAARRVGPEEFGALAVAVAVVYLVQHGGRAGFHVVLVQLPELRSSTRKEAFALSCFLAILASSFVFFISLVVDRISGVDGAGRLSLQLTPLVALMVIGAVPEGIAVRNKSFAAMFRVELFAAVATLASVLVLLQMGFGIAAVAAGTTVDALIRTLGHSIVTRTGAMKLPGRRALSLVRRGAPIAAAAVANEVALRADYLVVGRVLGAAAVGVYERAYQFLSASSLLLGQPLERLVFADQSRSTASAGREKLITSVAAMSAMLLPAGALLSAILPGALLLLLGPEWESVRSPLRVLLWVTFARVGYRMADGFVLALGLNSERMRAMALYAIAVAACAVVGSRWGLVGVAVGVSVAVSFYYGLLLFLAARELDVPYRTIIAGHLLGLGRALIIGAVLAVAPIGSVWQIAALLVAAALTVIWVSADLLATFRSSRGGSRA